MALRVLQFSAAILLLTLTRVGSADDPINVFLDALNKGESTAPIIITDTTAPVIRAMQHSTGSSGDIMIHAKLIKRFVQQSHCGRINFYLEQPSSKHVWPEIGGQFNICEDGLPPWRVCKANPTNLVPPNASCPNGQPSVDTPEVQAAIEESLKHGSLSREQVMEQLQQRQKKEKIKHAVGPSQP